MDKLTEYINLALIQDTNNNGQFDNRDISYYDHGYSNGSASITKTLRAGTYFIGVNPFYGNGNTNYTAKLTA